MKTIYLISGPLGAGKSSIAKEIHLQLEDSSLIEGDIFLHELENRDITWEKKLELSWDKILIATKKYLKQHDNVIIDFVVEEELAWFKKQLSDQAVRFKYYVLITDKRNIIKRLTKRNDIKYLDRALVLLDILTRDKKHKKYLYDTTNKNIHDIAIDIIH